MLHTVVAIPTMTPATRARRGCRRRTRVLSLWGRGRRRGRGPTAAAASPMAPREDPSPPPPRSLPSRTSRVSSNLSPARSRARRWDRRADSKLSPRAPFAVSEFAADISATSLTVEDMKRSSTSYVAADKWRLPDGSAVAMHAPSVDRMPALVNALEHASPRRSRPPSA